MPNVKPGDLAKIVVETTPDGHSNVGRQVEVINFPQPPNSAEQLILGIMTRRHGLMQVCVALQPIWAGQLSSTRELCPPGEVLIFPDTHLRRIDPPADTSELLAEFPLPDEHRSMEDLAQYIKGHS